MVSFLSDFWNFMSERKKFWMLPIMIVLIAIGFYTRRTPSPMRREVLLYSFGIVALSHQFRVFSLFRSVSRLG